jgi:hypothetical protein
MCDALSRNLPSDFVTLLANCLVHARRNFVDVHTSFPKQCQLIIEILAEWKELTWEAIHGNNPKINGGRAFDGAFFRTRNIKGDVVIRNNRVRHAANGIHMFNRTEGKTNRNQLNHNVQI